jgi:N-acetyl-gamma-glutamyl-phosphate reductase
VPRVFIDGQAGTTGLEIAARLANRRDLDVLEIDPAVRKDPQQRRELMSSADAVVLCLPDDAALEAVALIDNPRTKVLDASTAHRVAPDWVYGLPELEPAQRDRIRSATRVSNPGCYATGFILSVRPLIDAGVLSSDVPLSAHGLSGYSGGGRSMIETYRAKEHAGLEALFPPRSYGLTLAHKHVPEMRKYSGTKAAPLFVPIVAQYYKGMIDHVPLFNAQLERIAHAEDIHELLVARYADEPCVRVLPFGGESALENGYLSPTAANNTNRIDMMVFGNETRTLIVTRYDNLGKGASGAAVQNLNLMLGLPELNGLTLEAA